MRCGVGQDKKLAASGGTGLTDGLICSSAHLLRRCLGWLLTLARGAAGLVLRMDHAARIGAGMQGAKIAAGSIASRHTPPEAAHVTKPTPQAEAESCQGQLEIGPVAPTVLADGERPGFIAAARSSW